MLTAAATGAAPVVAAAHLARAFAKGSAWGEFLPLALFWRSWSWSREAVPDSLTAARTGLVTATVSVASFLMIWLST